MIKTVPYHVKYVVNLHIYNKKETLLDHKKAQKGSDNEYNESFKKCTLSKVINKA